MGVQRSSEPRRASLGPYQGNLNIINLVPRSGHMARVELISRHRFSLISFIGLLIAAGPLVQSGIAHSGQDSAATSESIRRWLWLAPLLMSFLFLAFNGRNRLRWAYWLSTDRSAVLHSGLSRFGQVFCALVGVTCFALLIGSLFIDPVQAELLSQRSRSLALGFLVGIPVLALTFGNIWPWLSPWHVLHRIGGLFTAAFTGSVTKTPLEPALPLNVGHWPAALVATTFWLTITFLTAEMAIPPQVLATVLVLYAALQLVGSAFFGRRFFDRFDGLLLLSKVFSAAAPLRLDFAKSRLSIKGSWARGSDLPQLSSIAWVCALMLSTSLVLSQQFVDKVIDSQAWVDLQVTMYSATGDSVSSHAVVECLAVLGLACLIWAAGGVGAAVINRFNQRQVFTSNLLFALWPLIVFTSLAQLTSLVGLPIGLWIELTVIGIVVQFVYFHRSEACDRQLSLSQSAGYFAGLTILSLLLANA